MPADKASGIAVEKDERQGHFNRLCPASNGLGPGVDQGGRCGRFKVFHHGRFGRGRVDAINANSFLDDLGYGPHGEILGAHFREEVSVSHGAEVFFAPRKRKGGIGAGHQILTGVSACRRTVPGRRCD